MNQSLITTTELARSAIAANPSEILVESGTLYARRVSIPNPAWLSLVRHVLVGASVRVPTMLCDSRRHRALTPCAHTPPSPPTTLPRFVPKRIVRLEMLAVTLSRDVRLGSANYFDLKNLRRGL